MVAAWTPDDAPPPKRTFVLEDDQGRTHRIIGLGTDDESRCAHHDGARDIVALTAPCCTPTWPCHACHDACSDHGLVPWPADRLGEAVVLCGACRHAMTAAAYLGADHTCPSCGKGFNRGCADHRARHFETQ